MEWSGSLGWSGCRSLGLASAARDVDPCGGLLPVCAARAQRGNKKKKEVCKKANRKKG